MPDSHCPPPWCSLDSNRRTTTTTTTITSNKDKNEIDDIELQRQLAHVPITSAAVYDCPLRGKQYILAGEHNAVVVYSKAEEEEEGKEGKEEAAAAAPLSKPWLCRLPVFKDQTVHGMRVQGRRLLVWGGSQVAVLDGEALLQRQRQPGDGDGQAQEAVVLASGAAPDWIHDGLLSQWDEHDASVVLVSAHNEVLWMKCTVTRDLVLEQDADAVSPSRPMLYVAQLAWLSRRSVLVAAGTVFGTILVWKAEEKTATMLAALRGHEGSIYGVDISPMVALRRGMPVRLLASCSDDRTIRVWDISEASADHSVPATTTAAATPHVGEDDHDTGFKAAASYERLVPETSDKGDLSPVAVAMGHASRIWGVKFAAAAADGNVCIYSFGEDATAQKWQLDLAQGTLVKGQTYALHDGKHLWARSVHVKDAVDIVTGGADSKICLVEEKSAGMTLTASVNLAVREVISRYDFVDGNTMLAITNLGRLFLGNLAQNSWEEVAVHENLRECYVLRSIGRGAIVMGTTQGAVHVWNAAKRDLVTCTNVTGRIVEMSCISSETGLGETIVEVIVHMHGSPCSRVLTLDTTTGQLDGEAHVKGLDERFVPVSAARMGEYLIMGSRHGYMALLTVQNKCWSPVLEMATHSRDAITSIVLLPSKDEIPSQYILATSRDGMYRIYKVEAAALVLLHETAPPFGPMIEGAWFVAGPDEPELLLYGFRSKDFVVWNESRKEEMASVNCGGAHRTFRLNHSAVDMGRLKFAYTRTSKLFVHSQVRVDHKTIKTGVHGREIRALSFNGRLIASGAEDTSIRIWECAEAAGDPRKSVLRCLAYMDAHVTGIQRLHWFEDDYLFSSAGNGELFVWRVRPLDSGYRGLAVVREATFVDESPVKDLRIMDFDVSRRLGTLVVSLAFSNSTLKAYEYDGQGSFKLLSTGSYTGACLTQLRHLRNRAGGLDVMTASTDGYLAIWSTAPEPVGAKNEFTLAVAAAVHQSSVKSLDMVTARNGRSHTILTGGDDNAIGVTLLEETDTDEPIGRYHFRARNVVRKAHAAAVNGVAILPKSADGPDMFGASVSNDQRIKVWRLGRDEVSLAACASSGVADPGDIAAISGGRIVVGGVGVETWSVW
ncbi:WD repeat protein [Moelleriella libera RCEF 2490]|uniref:WD repeat protein n=1 Tax=Moelleriella libera RCEF 2490 TaxID=1081109 RepID=A0A167Z2B9_9HYPO|nr:WD repeat protein [Moelleriella libera RCEF 2490]